jgi:hypothetical protein
MVGTELITPKKLLFCFVLDLWGYTMVKLRANGVVDYHLLERYLN